MLICNLTLSFATLRVAPAARGPFYSTTCSSIALGQATRSGRRAIDDLAADHGRDNTRLANGLERYRKDVLRQDGEIRQLARFQCADLRVGKGCEGRTL